MTTRGEPMVFELTRCLAKNKCATPGIALGDLRDEVSATSATSAVDISATSVVYLSLVGRLSHMASHGALSVALKN